MSRNGWIFVGLIAGAAGWLWLNGRKQDSYELKRAKESNSAQGWREYAENAGGTGRAKRELAKLHERARRAMALRDVPSTDKLDALLAALAERASNQIALEAADLAVDRESFAAAEAALAQPGAEVVPIHEGLRQVGYTCAMELTAAFSELTGSDIITIHQQPMATPAARMILSGSVRASGTAYASQSSQRIFTGIEVTASVKLLAGTHQLIDVDMTVTPGPDLEYASDPMRAYLGSDQGDIASGLQGAACRRLGEEPVFELTGWRRPRARAADPLAVAIHECEQGSADACLTAGRSLQTGDGAKPDGVKAQDMFERGCRASGVGAADACVAFADLVLADPTPSLDKLGMSDKRAKASIALNSGCRLHNPLACRRRGELSLLPYHAGTPTSAYGYGEAQQSFVRACDLGDAVACHRAAIHAADGHGVEGQAPSPMQARMLAQRGCRGGEVAACTLAQRWKKPLTKPATFHGFTTSAGDELFDVRYGSWFPGEDTTVLWFASKTAGAHPVRAAGATAAGSVRSYLPGAIPPGVEPPDWAVSVYAITTSARWKDAQPCLECSPGAHTNPLWPSSCTCLPPLAGN